MPAFPSGSASPSPSYSSFVLVDSFAYPPRIVGAFYKAEEAERLVIEIRRRAYGR